MATRYHKHKLQNIFSVEDIITIHYMELKQDFDFRSESHDFWELVYVDKESVLAHREGQAIVVNEGEILFHKPNELHSLAANGKTAPNVFILSFVCKSRAMQFFENKKLSVHKNLVKFIYMIAEEGKKTFDLPYFNPNLTKMELLETPILGGEQLIKNYLEALLINLIRNESDGEKQTTVFLRREEKEGNITARVISFLHEHVGERLTVENVCEQINYNKSYVFRIFKRDTGTTVMNYFIRLKIERAKQLLREDKLNITQISELLAFDTPNYFSKTFRKITNYSPLQYKKIYLTSV